MNDKFLEISLQLISIIYILPIIYVFIKKEKAHSIENKIYTILLFLVPIILIFDIISILSTQSFFQLISKNILYSLMFLWIIIITYYLNIHAFQDKRIIIDITEDTNIKMYKKLNIIYFIVYIIITLIIFIATLTSTSNTLYSKNIFIIVIIIASIIAILCIFFSIKDYLKKHKRDYVPTWLLILTIVSTFILEIFLSEMNLFSSIIAFCTFYMYFTLDIPDINLIENLKVAQKQSEKANLSKTELLLSISKDIKTPLNAISGFSNALKEENLDRKSTQEAESIYNASNQLMNIVNEIIDISNIETGRLIMNNSEYDAKRVFDDVASLGRVRLSNKRINFNYQINNDIPEVLFGDSKRIKQILLNIITNATKYTEEGYISFIVNTDNYADNCHIQVIIDDSGPGISKERQELILNSYNYIKISNNLNGLGTGYGLAITKKLVEAMNGTFQLSSATGRGTKIKIELDQKISSKRADELTRFDYREVLPFDASNINVLVVDDNMVNLKVAKRFLKKYKINADIIDSGDGCLKMVKESNKYNIIFLDDQMPGLSGKETIRRLRAIPGFSSIVIALTSNDNENVREEYKLVGFTDYLKKPIDSDELHYLLKKYLKK